MKKLIHLADVHFSKESQDLALQSLECALEAGKREQIQAWAFAGDLFDRSVANSAASGFPRLINVIQRMLEIAPIVSIEGTVTHDVPGAYSVLSELQADYRFINLHPDDAQVVVGILFFGMPEAGKEWLLAGGEGLSADDTNRKLAEAVRSILLGFGAIRAAQPEVPAVLLLHGPVKGASLQNRTVMADGIGREDLQLVGFDYGALGHVHLEQKIDGVEAYYPGPAYHTDWGHLGTCGCNLVEINEAGNGDYYPLTVTRVNYPHPRRVKFSMPWPEPASAEDVAGVQAWICIKATKEQAEEIDTEAILDAYIEEGALSGSRVTVELIPTETVRAGEITEKHALRDKVLVYAEASAEKETSFIPNIAASIFLKADQLEREAEERGAVAGFHFRLRRLRLRGAVGIWKGLRQDEIDIDLDQRDPGLIALVGVNGAGKSTLIENMHPYPCMLTRDGKLQDHFRLRDSARELWFVDERTGTEYRALMEIDGANASGAVKYHLFRERSSNNPEKGYEWEPLTNGRKEDYEQAITGLIGSLPLFLRSAFVSQRPTKSNPDLSDATKGERKAIFRELAGLDYLQAYAESAKARAGAIEGSITTGRGQVELLVKIVSEESEIVDEEIAAEAAVKRADESIDTLTTTGKELREKVELLHALRTEQEQIERDAKEADRVRGTKGYQAGTAQEEINTYTEALGQRELAQKAVTTHAQLKEQEGKENERLSAINAKRAGLSTEYGNALKAHSDAVRGLEAARTRLRTEKARMEGDHAVSRERCLHLEKELAKPLTENCPTCGQLLPEDKRQALHTEREGKQADLATHGKTVYDLGNQIMCKDGEIRAIKDPAGPTPPELPPVDETELKRIRAALGQLDITAAQKVLEAAAQAEAKIAELTARIETLEKEAAELATKAEDLRTLLNPQIALDHAEAVAQYEQARADYTTAKEERATAAAKLEAAEKQLAGIAKQKLELEELRTSLASMEAEAAEWRYLSEATGPDGIQALELDALGPGIAETANRLLSAAYGSRFSIEFRTTRLAGKGSKTKSVEDFAIYVIDNELLTEQPIETLSGGEAVWIKQALYSSFAIIRDRSTGIRFLTAFKDECDGALDPESRAKYFQLLQAEHAESGRRHTLIITHSESAQEMIPQKIEMRRAS